ncbi:two-component system, OmpR family, response regulator [Rhizobium sp. RU35A]|uniref:Response regulator transcription factor n=1 Tax=Rhizobium straminoryzae TaxID=1387186 RepID=A0A549T7I8_9HYPH|nr:MULTISPECIES: response regulator transcription factor [Rhizobium]TRL37831.1 response regulator transcription factor [Rhizobium straminoryzae]SIQ95309.1 two-component system, OmpR family, response regulator [Rhizobium sp. RU35A]
MRVLLVEDDELLGDAVKTHVARQGHAVDWAQNLDDAEANLAAARFDLILLDLRLPDGFGIDILKRLRARRDATPVIIMTAHDQVADRIEGLNAGADDYLVKPVDLGELQARIHAVARRYGASALPEVVLGATRVFPSERRIVGEDGQDIGLSSREWALLDRLLSRRQAIFSKSQLEDALYDFGAEVESNTVEVYVSRLRRKLGKEVIETVRGLGYRISPHV